MEAHQPRACGAATGPSVLVVDDDAALRSLLKAVLDDAGCRTTTAAHGAEALEFLARDRFHVVVLDLDMPVMDGVECYRRMQQRGPVPPTLVLSAQFDGRAVARDLGVSAAMSKPFDTDDLRRTVFALYRESTRAEGSA